jgi:hypothetical protein
VSNGRHKAGTRRRQATKVSEHDRIFAKLKENPRVGVGGKVDSSLVGGKSEERADKSRVLVRESVVLLPPEGRGLDVVKRRVLSSPVGLGPGFDKLKARDKKRTKSGSQRDVFPYPFSAPKLDLNKPWRTAQSWW